MANLAARSCPRRRARRDVEHARSEIPSRSASMMFWREAVLAAKPVAAVLRDEADTVADGIARAADLHGSSVDADLAGPHVPAPRRTSPSPPRCSPTQAARRARRSRPCRRARSSPSTRAPPAIGADGRSPRTSSAAPPARDGVRHPPRRSCGRPSSPTMSRRARSPSCSARRRCGRRASRRCGRRSRRPPGGDARRR